MSGKEDRQSPEPVTARPTRYGIREKLLALFIGIKVLPLIALALLAAQQIGLLGDTVKEKAEEMVGDTRKLVTQIGDLASESSIRALDLKSRESIERLTTDTANSVAAFLYERDSDILLAYQHQEVERMEGIIGSENAGRPGFHLRQRRQHLFAYSRCKIAQFNIMSAPISSNLALRLF